MVVVERGKRTRESHSPSKSEGNVKVPATTTATMASGTSTSNVKVNFLQNMSNSELNMIHRLAGNDPEARKATIKKLRKWLKAMATKVPDGILAREAVGANFGRTWKALFYCMWMADKPLPQETLAEQISNLVSIFGQKPDLMILFVEWFFITFVREWPWIDRLRMDKFMMLIRRFLRKTLQEFSKLDWADENLEQLVNVLTVHLFNHHPQISKSKRRKSKEPEPLKAPLGFQIHIVDIFLEELAKVGGTTLESEKILKIISPFVREMAENDDQRLLDEIQERIFYHLMKQSDTGIDYIESRGGTLELMELQESDMDDYGDDEGDEMVMHQERSTGPLDPRAGQVDVILPQLNVNYESLVEMLSTAANNPNAKSKNRKSIYALVRKFQALTKGHYPLGFKQEPKRLPAIRRSEIEAAAKRLIEEEEALFEPKIKRKRKRQKQALLDDISSTENEIMCNEDLSVFLNGSDLESFVEENGHHGDEYSADVQTNISSTPDNSTPPVPQSQSLVKKRKKLKSGASPSVEMEPIESEPTSVQFSKTENGYDKSSSDGDTYVVIKRKRRNSDPQGNSRKKNEKPPLSADQVSKIYSSLIANTKRKKQEMPLDVELRTPSPKSQRLTRTSQAGIKPNSSESGTPVSSKKKVNFSLTKNLEHPHSDYQDSIQRSPAIPYDGKKRPSFSLLKAKTPTKATLSPRKRILTAATGSRNISSPASATTPRNAGKF